MFQWVSSKFKTAPHRVISPDNWILIVEVKCNVKPCVYFLDIYRYPFHSFNLSNVNSRKQRTKEYLREWIIIIAYSNCSLREDMLTRLDPVLSS